jgi:hypothetical protein
MILGMNWSEKSATFRDHALSPIHAAVVNLVVVVDPLGLAHTMTRHPEVLAPLRASLEGRRPERRPERACGTAGAASFEARSARASG